MLGKSHFYASYVCSEILSKRYLRGGREGKGQRCRKGTGGGGVLLEGSSDTATLERLGRTVVIHHAAFGLPLSGEEQAAEFGHL